MILLQMIDEDGSISFPPFVCLCTEEFHETFRIKGIDKNNRDARTPQQGSPRLLITGFKVFSRIFKVNNNNSQKCKYFKAQPPLSPLLSIHSSHKILCHDFNIKLDDGDAVVGQ